MAHETISECSASPRACAPVGSATLARLIRPKSRCGYDLVVHAGLARHLHAHRRDEIRSDLAQEGIDVAAGTVSHLCDQFLVYLEALHVHRAPALRTALARGYPLHVDATCDQGRGGLFVCLDGFWGWVLAAAHISSEREAVLAPLVEKTVALFGQPLSTMRDLSDAQAKAVAPLRDRGVADLVCHYHFLRALGTKLFEGFYKELRTCLLQSGVAADLKVLARELCRHDEANAAAPDGPFGSGPIRDGLPALVQWVLEGVGTKDLPFPFGLPYLDLLVRARDVPQLAERFLPCPRTDPEWVALGRLKFLAGKLDQEPFTRLWQKLQEPRHAFGELRDVLRLTNAELPGASRTGPQLSFPALELARLKEIEHGVERYQKRLNRTASPAASTIRTYLDRYGPHLFGHPAVRDETGVVFAVASRVNNVLEQTFGRQKQLLRERVGRAHLGRDMEQQPPQAFLARNLRDPRYVELLCGCLDRLPEAFADLDARNLVPPVSSLRDRRRATLRGLARSIIDPSAPQSPRASPRRKASRSVPTVL